MRNKEPLNVRVVGGLLAGGLGVLSLAGCSSGSQENNSSTTSAATSSSAGPAPETTCTPVTPEKWSGTPTNFNAEKIAQRLGVAVAAVQQTGRFGGATCAEPIPVSRIGTPDAAVVSVTGEGSPCLVIGTAEDPRTITSTKNILAVCAGGTDG